MKDFTHLHVHTDASLRDGLGTVENLVGRAKQMGFKHLAITDHGTLANSVTFAMEANRAGIKPILGLEGYVEFDGKIGHITLLADGAVGWNSLVKLNNLAHQSEFKQPAFKIYELLDHHEGLICLTGCIASPINQLPYRESKTLAYKLKSVFGPRLFAELMFVGDSLSWQRPNRIAEEVGLRRVITNDVHFPLQTQAPVHPILTRMKSGFDYESAELYMKSRQQLSDQASFFLPVGQVEDMLDRTAKIGAVISGVELKAEPALPYLGSTKTSFANMVRTTKRGYQHLRPANSYDRRIEHEIQIISDMGFADYFVILNDIIQYAKTIGARIGPGRGSGAGSLALYFLGITDVDPIEHGLQFERFLNSDRVSMPDVDVDIESERREMVLDYAETKFSAIPIATYSRYSHKSLARDLGRYFGIEQKRIDLIADKGSDSKEFAEVLRDYPLFELAYDSFVNQIRHKGKHAGGVIITDTPVPVERVSDKFAAAWSEGGKSDLSYAGIVKFDLLGLSALTALRSLEDKLDDGYSEYKFDKNVYREIFEKGDLAGIFQFSGSDGIRDLTMKIKPRTLADLAVINALYRPGPLLSGATEKYLKWQKKPRKVPPEFSAVLDETYGAIIFQEQVMKIYQIVVGGTLSDADSMRRIISKPKPDNKEWRESLQKFKDTFIEGMVNDWGHSPRAASKWWKELETHSQYSFNKSHATAYAMIAWECACWKTYYPAHFLAEMLNVDPAHKQTYLINAVQQKLTVSPPHVNVSTDKWAAKETTIFMPLSSIKFLGQAGAASIMTAREDAGGKFESAEHFMKAIPKRLVNSRARMGLYVMDGFSGLFGSETMSVLKQCKILQIKTTPDMLGLSLHPRRGQLKYLGAIIPDDSLFKAMEREEKRGKLCGVIVNIESKTGKYGTYKVFRLSPNGTFWSNKIKDELMVGDAISVEMGKRGKAQAVRILREA